MDRTTDDVLYRAGTTLRTATAKQLGQTTSPAPRRVVLVTQDGVVMTQRERAATLRDRRTTR